MNVRILLLTTLWLFTLVFLGCSGGDDSNTGPAGDPSGEEPGRITEVGPYVEFVGRDSAVVRWRSETPAPSVVEYGENDVSEHTVTDPALTTDHAVTIKGLKPNTTYSYRVQSSRGGSPWVSEVFSLETNCNYSLPDIPDRTSQDTGVQGTEAIEDAAAWILEDSGISRGYCLVLGSGNGRFAYELARRSRLRVVGVEADPDTVAEARSLLTREGIYGPRATVREVESLSRLPFPGHFANLVVAEPLSESDPIFEEIMRVLRPNGQCLSWAGGSRRRPVCLESGSKTTASGSTRLEPPVCGRP